MQCRYGALAFILYNFGVLDDDEETGLQSKRGCV